MGSTGTAEPVLPEGMELPEPLGRAHEELDAASEALLVAVALLPLFITKI